jgi:hypothetical protein
MVLAKRSVLRMVRGVQGARSTERKTDDEAIGAY